MRNRTKQLGKETERLHQLMKKFDIESRIDEIDELLKENPPTGFKGVLVNKKNNYSKMLGGISEDTSHIHTK